MLAKDVMSSNVMTVRPHLPARVAAALLVANGFTSAPVVTAEGLLRGIVTEADLMRGQPIPDPDQTDDEPAPDTTAGEVMTPEPVTMRPTDDLADVAAVMLANGVRSVPVVEDGRLVGIISRRDVLRCVARRELVAKGIDPESRRPTMGLADRDLRP
jgi:CBS domain-containing protein